MPIIISSRENLHIKAAVRLRSSAAQRRALGKFFLEGFRLCADALASGCAPEQLFLTGEARSKYDTAPLEQASAHTFEITEQVAQKLADTQSPQGVFAICAQPPSLARGVPEGRGELCLALENLRDPGNLGAAARTAQALGLHGLLLSGGCDIYHPKALRASMGALLRLPVSHVDDLPAALRASALPCYAAVPDAGALPVTACDFTRGAVVVIGSEADGLTPETIAACTRQVTIPMPGRAESLNAAAAATIIMWEMTKQLTVDN